MPLDERSKAMYQPWNHEEFCADVRVRRMTPGQRRSYVMLLHEAFFCSSRPYLPNDEDALELLADCENVGDWQRDRVAVLKMFEAFEIDGIKLLRQKRVETDWDRLLDARDELSAKNSGNAKSGWAKRRREKAKPKHATLCETDATAADLMPLDAKGSEVKQVSEDKRSEGEEDPLNESDFENQEDTDMKAKKRIPVICRTALGIKAEIWPQTWAEVKETEDIYGSSEVIRAFEDWCVGKRGEIVDKPVTAFLKVADGILNGVLESSGSAATTTNPSDTRLVDELLYISDGVVAPNASQNRQLAAVSQEFGLELVVSVFKTYFNEKVVGGDDFVLRMATKNFVETAAGLCRLALRKKQEADNLAALVDRQRTDMKAQADAESEALRAKQVEEDELSDVGL